MRHSGPKDGVQLVARGRKRIVQGIVATLGHELRTLAQRFPVDIDAVVFKPQSFPGNL